MRSINLILTDLKFDIKQLEIGLEYKVNICKKENRKVIDSDLCSSMDSFNDIMVDLNIYMKCTRKLTIKEWISDFSDLSRRLYNIGIKVLRIEHSEFAIDIFKRIIQVTFEFSIITDDCCNDDDSKTNIDKIRNLVKKSFQCLCERLSAIGNYKKALTIIALYCAISEQTDETTLRNMLLVVRKHARNSRSDVYTYSLIQSLEFVSEFIPDECTNFKLDSKRLWTIFDFELKIISEEWPDVNLLNMICDSYYDLVNESLDFSTIVWIYLRLFIFHKQIPDKWLQKWYTFPYNSKSNDSLTTALSLLVQYEIKLKQFKSNEMPKMNDFLAIFDKKLNESLKILLSLNYKQMNTIRYPIMFNNFLKLVIFECRFNQFYEYELQASLIYYRFNKIMNNDLEVWFISSYLIEKLSPRSKLHREIMSLSKQYLKTDTDWLFYSLLFQLRLCKLYFYQQKIDDARDVLKSLKENLKLVPKNENYLNSVSIYVEFLDYLNLMLPCGQHPNFKYVPEVLCDKVKSSFKKTSSYVMYRIELSSLVDILKGLIFYQKNVEQPDSIARYYQILEHFADTLKYYKLTERVQYEILLLQLKYKPLKEVEICYKNFTDISIIHYDKSNNLDTNCLTETMNNLQLRNVEIQDKRPIFDILENTSEILEDHSRKNEKSLSNIEIFFHNVHISILYHLLKTYTYNTYFRNLFEIGYELRKQYNECIQNINGCQDASSFLYQQFTENFLPFMFDIANYYSTFRYYKTALEICDSILKMAPKNADVTHIICLKTNLKSFLKKCQSKQITDSSESALSH